MRFATSNCTRFVQYRNDKLASMYTLNNWSIEVIIKSPTWAVLSTQFVDVSDGVVAHIRKALIAFGNLRHLWSSRNICLSLMRGRVYSASVRSVVLSGRDRYIRLFLVFNHRYIRSIACTWLKQCSAWGSLWRTDSFSCHLAYVVCRACALFMTHSGVGMST